MHFTLKSLSGFCFVFLVRDVKLFLHLKYPVFIGNGNLKIILFCRNNRLIDQRMDSVIVSWSPSWSSKLMTVLMTGIQFSKSCSFIKSSDCVKYIFIKLLLTLGLPSRWYCTFEFTRLDMISERRLSTCLQKVWWVKLHIRTQTCYGCGVEGKTSEIGLSPVPDLGPKKLRQHWKSQGWKAETTKTLPGAGHRTIWAIARKDLSHVGDQELDGHSGRAPAALLSGLCGQVSRQKPHLRTRPMRTHL